MSDLSLRVNGGGPDAVCSIDDNLEPANSGTPVRRGLAMTTILVFAGPGSCSTPRLSSHACVSVFVLDEVSRGKECCFGIHGLTGALSAVSQVVMSSWWDRVSRGLPAIVGLVSRPKNLTALDGVETGNGDVCTCCEGRSSVMGFLLLKKPCLLLLLLAASLGGDPAGPCAVGVFGAPNLNLLNAVGD